MNLSISVDDSLLVGKQKATDETHSDPREERYALTVKWKGAYRNTYIESKENVLDTSTILAC